MRSSQISLSWRDKIRLSEDLGEKLRKTRVLYLEGDPALRFLLANELRKSPLLDLVFAGPSLSSAASFAQRGTFDVALIETSQEEGDSAEALVSNLRRRDSNCGILVYTKEPSIRFLRSVKPDERLGLSVLQKRDPVDFELIFNTLVRTAEGHSSVDTDIVGENHIENVPDAGLSVRYNTIMLMLADGKNTEFISRTLNLAQVTVRQELSKIYLLLVPNRTEGLHLRTEAVAVYLERINQVARHKTDAGVRLSSAAD